MWQQPVGCATWCTGLWQWTQARQMAASEALRITCRNTGSAILPKLKEGKSPGATGLLFTVLALSLCCPFQLCFERLDQSAQLASAYYLMPSWLPFSKWNRGSTKACSCHSSWLKQVACQDLWPGITPSYALLCTHVTQQTSLRELSAPPTHLPASLGPH